MRWIVCVAALATGFAPAVGQERPEDLVKAAVFAAGGAETLAKYPAGRVVGKGKMTFAGVGVKFDCGQAYHVPGRFRTMVTCEVKGQQWQLEQVVTGETAQQKINGRVVPLTDAGLQELQLAVVLNEVAQLTPLLSDKRFALKPDKAVKGPELGGVLVQVKGYPELRLAFDRKSGHLVRIAYKDGDAETEITFSEFRAVSGLTRPARSVVTRDGKTVVDLTIEKFEPLEKLDAWVFQVKE